VSDEPAPGDPLTGGRLHARITGRVQGVGFRYSTRRVAERLGLKGWVANRPDGSVEVVAEGDPGPLGSFEGFLREGPPGAHVETCRLERSHPGGSFTGFEVRF
jgi:acylphosphatase